MGGGCLFPTGNEPEPGIPRRQAPGRGIRLTVRD